jgi:UDP-N-acetylmuramate--alanine ligase
MKNVDLKKFNSCYFIGIGGIGMSALARYFKLIGFNVAGYDKTETSLTKELVKEGINIHYDDKGSNIELAYKNTESCLVIVTPAIPSTLNELKFFHENQFILLKRAEVLGIITQNSLGLCVAGTHGKTTTSSMLAHILTVDDLKCNAFLGGISSNYNTNFISSETSKYAVIEADEFDRSFLKLSPHAAIITSIDPDHLDIYGDESTFLDGFKAFAQLIHKDGVLIVKNGISIPVNCKSITYSLGAQGDVVGSNIRVNNGYQELDIHFENFVWKNVQIGIPGLHNAENAMACVAMCNYLGISEEVIRMGLATFKGVKRRFEVHYRSENMYYIDDYAHHPTEIKAFVESLRFLFPSKRILVIFQPHLFSRTRDFLAQFAVELSKVDELILMPIYPARELPIEGINSELLLEKVTIHSKSIMLPDEVLKYISTLKDVVIATIGAGDIDKLVDPIQLILNSTKNG